MTDRTIARQHPSYRDDIADLITRRPLPGPGLQQVDPFLFLNHHGPQVYPPNNQGLPFGPHPHRGFETVTFILQGDLAHLDSGGHQSIITAAGVQWMTAGSGLVHAELSPAAFKARGGPLEILQLWLNLPGRLKMTAPRYIGVQASEIPTVIACEGKVKVQLIAGHYAGGAGPVPSLTDVFITTIALAPGGIVRMPAPKGRNVFLYVVRGEIVIDGVVGRQHHLIELTDGDSVEMKTDMDAMILFGHGGPIRPRPLRDEHSRGDRPGDHRLQRRQVRLHRRLDAGRPDAWSAGLVSPKLFGYCSAKRGRIAR